MTTTTRAPRRDAAENRVALLAAAKIELNQNPDASLEAIAARAGLSRRSVYGHFTSRDELLSELIVTGAKRIAGAVGGLGHPDSRAAIAALGTSLWAEVDHVRPMAQLAVRGPLMSAVGKALAPLRSALVDTVVRGQEAGELRRDLSATAVARLIEGAALAVLDEANRRPITAGEGRRLVVLAGLGAAGLDWREAGEYV